MASVAELDFEGASEFVRTAKFAASNEQKLQMYALFKQASVGDCTTGRPGGFLSAFSAEGLKWKEWKALAGMGREEAMVKYVKLVDQIVPKWRQNDTTQDESQKMMEADDEDDGPVYSRMGAVTGETDENETTTDLIEASTSGDFEKVSSLIASNPTPEFVNETSSLGETALHMAADRGFLNIVEILVKNGANVNHQDGDGFTPLHMACTSGHEDIAMFLVQNGARLDIGESPLENAPASLVAKLSSPEERYSFI
eukprot:TRINITY_DN6148_c0_g1_i1.p1 TRINITY_DN6148_c0_g1~~TRINITY_DN6148_c0_g1_i1.p1  ORF type:complete len:255 (+),score=88.63 TRINITY_DN6148_c0_g1_i1:10-774(+)